MEAEMKLGVVDVGGGLRGIYAAGVFDYCLEQGIQFDLCIGVSAGSANAASYVAGQRARNYSFYIDYPFRRQYMSVRNFLFKGSYLDLDYVYGTGYIYVNDLGAPYQPNFVTQHFKILLKNKGLRAIRFHDLRHTCASLLLKNGVSMKEIQEWLGHSSFSTTANIYAHLDTAAKDTSAVKLNSALPIQASVQTSI